MFTGIVEEVGTVQQIRRGSADQKIIIRARKVLGAGGSMRGYVTSDPPTRIGDSIAVNGVCLTVTEMTGSSFTADVMPETFSRSSLGNLRPGSPVNLERAMPANGRFGGHIVTGHIDATGKIQRLMRDGNAIRFTIEAGDSAIRHIVTKGSITIDGISLTVTAVDRTPGNGNFQVSIIPHTLKETALSGKKAGDIVNLETDIVGKYIEQFMGGQKYEQV